MSSSIAEQLAEKQKEISVAEFFERNRHILGFDTLARALVTSVKEAVDNSLDACEEANILPDLYIEVERVSKNEYRIVVEDNGPGIVKTQIPKVFGQLLYGSRFYTVRQSRGQQGIGISGVVMYSQLTTGRPTRIISKIGPERPAHLYDLIIDTKRNRPEILREDTVPWDKDTGTRLEAVIMGQYVREKRQSVLEYLKSTAMINPHSQIVFKEPDGTVVTFSRASEKLPQLPVEIKPHPEGVELGTILKMAKESESHKFTSFLINDFSRIGSRTAREICTKAFLDADLRPQDLSRGQAKRLLQAFRSVKIMAPPTDCLSPLGEVLIKRGVKKEIKADMVATATRPPSVYSGNPFQVEAGVAYGGELPNDQLARVIRYANRVPLLYQQGDCVITKAIESMDWRRYGLEQRGGEGLPIGPVVFLVHVASTSVPYTSESKEAIAEVPEIRNEVELAMRECGRRMQAHIKKSERLLKLKEKEEIIKKILPLIADKSAKVLNRPVPDISSVVAKIMDSVLIEGESSYVDGFYRIKIDVTNYTVSSKVFDLYLRIPSTAEVEEASPKPDGSRDGLVIWGLRLKPSDFASLSLRMGKLEAGDYDVVECYVDKIDPEKVMGAEVWNGGFE
jgi:DNA topoisomerase-6 subunit B